MSLDSGEHFQRDKRMQSARFPERKSESKCMSLSTTVLDMPRPKVLYKLFKADHRDPHTDN